MLFVGDEKEEKQCEQARQPTISIKQEEQAKKLNQNRGSSTDLRLNALYSALLAFC